MDKLEADRRQLILEMVVLKGRAMELNMLKTFYALDEATKVVGWELAEKLEENEI